MDYPYDMDRIKEIADLMIKTLCSSRPAIRVASDELPAALVKERLERINVFHLDYVMDSMKKVTTPIHNMKAYLLTALFNAPATMDSKQTVDYQRFRAVGVDY